MLTLTWCSWTEVYTIAASKDFFYHHNFEIQFENVFTIIGNIEWIVNTKETVIDIISENKTAYDLNIQYCVEQGHTIFLLKSEDVIINYIIAENISFKNEVTKYF